MSHYNRTLLDALASAEPAQAVEAVAFLAEALAERADEEPGYKPACVLAAAPDLLIALRTALTWMETMKRNDPTITDAGPLAHNIAQVRAIIAKAGG